MSRQEQHRPYILNMIRTVFLAAAMAPVLCHSSTPELILVVTKAFVKPDFPSPFIFNFFKEARHTPELIPLNPVTNFATVHKNPDVRFNLLRLRQTAPKLASFLEDIRWSAPQSPLLALTEVLINHPLLAAQLNLLPSILNHHEGQPILEDSLIVQFLVWLTELDPALFSSLLRHLPGKHRLLPTLQDIFNQNSIRDALLSLPTQHMLLILNDRRLLKLFRHIQRNLKLDQAAISAALKLCVSLIKEHDAPPSLLLHVNARSLLLNILIYLAEHQLGPFANNPLAPYPNLLQQLTTADLSSLDLPPHTGNAAPVLLLSLLSHQSWLHFFTPNIALTSSVDASAFIQMLENHGVSNPEHSLPIMITFLLNPSLFSTVRSSTVSEDQESSASQLQQSLEPLSPAPLSPCKPVFADFPADLSSALQSIPSAFAAHATPQIMGMLQQIHTLLEIDEEHTALFLELSLEFLVDISAQPDQIQQQLPVPLALLSMLFQMMESGFFSTSCLSEESQEQEGIYCVTQSPQHQIQVQGNMACLTEELRRLKGIACLIDEVVVSEGLAEEGNSHFMTSTVILLMRQCQPLLQLAMTGNILCCSANVEPLLDHLNLLLEKGFDQAKMKQFIRRLLRRPSLIILAHGIIQEAPRNAPILIAMINHLSMTALQSMTVWQLHILQQAIHIHFSPIPLTLTVSPAPHVTEFLTQLLAPHMQINPIEIEMLVEELVTAIPELFTAQSAEEVLQIIEEKHTPAGSKVPKSGSG